MTLQNAAATIAGSASVTAASKAIHAASSSIAGLATVAAPTHDHDTSRASLLGIGIFFINPSLVTLSQFFRPTAVPAQFRPSGVPTPRPQAIGSLPSSVTIGVTRKPPKSQKGGVPNEG